MYGEADDKRAEAAWKRAVIVACVLGGTALALTVAGLIVRIKWLSIAAAAAGGCWVYGWISMKVMPWSAYRKFLGDMRDGLKRETEGAFVSMGDETRVVDGVSVSDMLIGAGGDCDLLFYWDDEKPRPGLRPGARVRVTSFGKFVTRCEELTRLEPGGG